MKQVCIIGVGLIGGSFALDLKQYINGVRVLGIDQNKAHLTDALELGVIDQIGAFDNLIDADLVVLAGRAEVKSAVQSAGFSIEVSLSPVCKRWTLIGLIPR